MIKCFLIPVFTILVLTIIHQHDAAGIVHANPISSSNRSFTIDYENDTFLMDGKPFRFIAGSFHYFRTLPEKWRPILRAMRAAGLNAVTTYVEWSLHNPKENEYNWKGIADLELFIRTAAEEDLFVIFRPGPYICAERDMGGFPYWLLHKYPQIQLRTYDINYLSEVRTWYAQLMSKMEPYLYEVGGPIIMVQVENEYGSFYACDNKYMQWLRDETIRYTRNRAVLFTNDGPSQLPCGKTRDVLATLDFGSTKDDTKVFWDILRRHEPHGPLVNSEYYPGWLTHWQESMSRIETGPVLHTLKDMLDKGANVNFYMFFGGTNFGFTAGANDGGPGSFNVDVTSYDYDAPLDEAGDPTEKYYDIRNTLAEYVTLPDIPIPQKAPKMSLPDLQLKPLTTILSSYTRNKLGTPQVKNEFPMSFESLNQYSGFVLYETTIPTDLHRDPLMLKMEKLRDRGYVYVDRNFIGILSRENAINSIPVNLGLGKKLQILVENQGRINYGIANDFKGILGEVLLNTRVLTNWTMTGFPLEKYSDIADVVNYFSTQVPNRKTIKATIKTGFVIFNGQFNIDKDEIYDTYLDPTGWGKGLIFINGFNLGRYWPVAGPQVTLYVPKELLKKENNTIVMLEYQKVKDPPTISFTDTPDLDGPFHLKSQHYYNKQ